MIFSSRAGRCDDPNTLVRTIVYRWKFRQASTFLAKTAGRGFARAGKKLFVGEFCQAKKLTGADLININSLLKISYVSESRSSVRCAFQKQNPLEIAFEMCKFLRKKHNLRFCFLEL